MIDDLINFQILEFIQKDNFSIDAVIVKSLKDRKLVEDLVKLSADNLNCFSNLSSFLNAELNSASFCFINMDEIDVIDDSSSLDLFRKIRGKHKVVMYNESNETLQNIEFFKYINWMRLITLEGTL